MSDLEIVKRFKKRVIRKGADQCWDMIGTPNGSGYHRVIQDGIYKVATHVSIFINTGEWPKKGLYVCHHCDNPRCVNPKHLFVGTPSDNARDAERKGRRKHPKTKYCKRGHERKNNSYYNIRNGTKKRTCRTCALERARSSYSRAKELLGNE